LKKILALDFDGVICNSIDECLLVSYYAYTNTSDLSFDFSEINSNYKKQFRKYRYLVGPAHQFYYLWEIIINNNENIPEIFNKINSNKKLEEGFSNKFYTIRKELINDNYQRWIRLNPFYDDLFLILKENIDLNDLYIVTSKDLISVNKLLISNSIYIDIEHIFSRELSFSKVKLFKLLNDKYQIPYNNIIFVDDKISHLIEVKSLGVHCYLSMWGYIGPESVEIANYNNISTILLSDLSDKLIKC